MEYSTQCFCGNQIILGGAPAASASDCSSTCGGNSGEICGGGNRMSIYATGTLTVVQPPATQTTNLPGSWTYQGCYTYVYLVNDCSWFHS